MINITDNKKSQKNRKKIAKKDISIKPHSHIPYNMYQVHY